MEEKITFNFFEDSIEESTNKIARYFHLDECAVKKYINSFEEPADITTQKFVVDFGIHLGIFDSSNARIIGRHMTAMTKDGFEDILKRGLLDLVGVLTGDTVLNKFLRENQVIFDVQNKCLIIDGQEYIITSAGDECLFCIEQREIRCGKFERCDIREKMDNIGRKLYELGGTLEFFVSGLKKIWNDIRLYT